MMLNTNTQKEVKMSTDNRIMKTYNETTGALSTTTHDEWINTRTGETRVMQNVEKKYYGQKHFWKMYLFDFLAVLGIVESKQLDVICYIMENTQPSTNLFIGTQVEIAKRLDVSRQTVSEAIRKLLSCGFITKTETQGVYMVNPDVMVKGSEAKKRGLVITYTEEKSSRMELEAAKAGCLDIIDVEAL